MEIQERELPATRQEWLPATLTVQTAAARSEPWRPSPVPPLPCRSTTRTETSPSSTVRVLQCCTGFGNQTGSVPCIVHGTPICSDISLPTFSCARGHVGHECITRPRGDMGERWISTQQFCRQDCTKLNQEIIKTRECPDCEKTLYIKQTKLIEFFSL